MWDDILFKITVIFFSKLSFFLEIRMNGNYHSFCDISIMFWFIRVHNSSACHELSKDLDRLVEWRVWMCVSNHRSTLTHTVTLIKKRWKSDFSHPWSVFLFPNRKKPLKNSGNKYSCLPWNSLSNAIWGVEKKNFCSDFALRRPYFSRSSRFQIYGYVMYFIEIYSCFVWRKRKRFFYSKKNLFFLLFA